MEVTFLTNSLILFEEWRRSESTTEPTLFNFDAPTLSLNVTEEEFIDAIRQRAAKLNLSTELLNALELPRNSDGDVSSDLTSFLASLLGSFLPVFDAASSEGVDKKATTSIASGRPFKIVEVENPDQVSML
jgi:hypothetical protein